MTEETTAPAAAVPTAVRRERAGQGAGERAAPGPEERAATGAAAQPARDRGPHATQDGSSDRVTIRMPAEGAYLSVLRTATAGLAARLDFTLDEIEDLRIAVDEACGLLLSQAAPGASLDCDFTLGADSVTIAVSVLTGRAHLPARDTFAWTVLAALAGSVDAWSGPGDTLTIMLRKTRALSRSG